jgi:Fe-S oxidoreductase
MARMKLEAAAARAARHGVGARDRLVAALPRIAPVAARLAPLANLRDRVPGLARLSERVLGLDARRSLPRWRRDWFRDAEAEAAPPAPRGDVWLLADTFNRWFEPENLRAAVRVLRAAGYRARVPHAGRALCCGRTRMAAGQLDAARAEQRRMLDAFAGPLPVVGLEPSCLLTLRDELPALLSGAASRDLAGRAVLLDEFLARAPALPLGRLEGVAHVHGHCHQKAHDAWEPSLGALRAVPGLEVRPIAASCCGMAGAFGYQAETEAVSRAMAEAGAEDLVVAEGTSCRHQVADLAGRAAVHPVLVLDQALAAGG